MAGTITPEQRAKLTDAYEAYLSRVQGQGLKVTAVGGRGAGQSIAAPGAAKPLSLEEWAASPEAQSVLSGGAPSSPGTTLGTNAQSEASARAATMPNAGTAGGALGLEKAPSGYVPHLMTTDGQSVAGKANYYQGGAEYTEWQDQGEDQRVQWKQALWYAGFYGNQRPVLNGDIDPTDIAAMQGAMGLANLNGKSWEDAIAPRVQLGQQQGGPVGTQSSSQGASGAFDQAVTQLRDFAKSNGIGLTDDFVGRKAKEIAEGVVSGDEVFGTLRDKYVASAYPAWADSIRAGHDVKDLASPYIAQMAQTLEVPQDSIDLKDPTIAKALQAQDGKGNPATVPLWQFSQELKKDSRYQYTQNAWSDVGQQAYKVMQMFGLQG